MKLFLLTMTTIMSLTCWAGNLIPGYTSSGSNALDTALFRLYNLYYVPDCTSTKDSYEHIAPLLTKALQSNPTLVEYLTRLPLMAPISELHLKDLFEYQLAKIVAWKNVVEYKGGQVIPLSIEQRLEWALDDAIFRRLLPGDPIPRDILQFSREQDNKGTIKREVRWVSNYQGTYQGEETWLKRKRVFAPWNLSKNKDGQVVIKIVDQKNNESLNLILLKSVVEPGKPAQWVLTDSQAGLQFHDYFTGFCDDFQAPVER